eukprot:TRINITY_DN2948_c0_g1_i1.p1 TRINITY_DN2948_c0_g1~~TRINITY_DN2948_c0_g1_i1.p1  ORF type:complete len:408 (-),score=80.10 TRINITY_DN2948_c0_g1_i1:60-1283(-)
MEELEQEQASDNSGEDSSVKKDNSGSEKSNEDKAEEDSNSSGCEKSTRGSRWTSQPDATHLPPYLNNFLQKLQTQKQQQKQQQQLAAPITFASLSTLVGDDVDLKEVATSSSSTAKFEDDGESSMKRKGEEDDRPSKRTRTEDEADAPAEKPRAKKNIIVRGMRKQREAEAAAAREAEEAEQEQYERDQGDFQADEVSPDEDEQEMERRPKPTSEGAFAALAAKREKRKLEEQQRQKEPVIDYNDREGDPPEIDEDSASTTLHITNLVRPYLESDLKNLLAADGEIAKFWVDRFKTTCYVKYQTTEAAIETTQRLSGVRWPLRVGKFLHVEFVDPIELTNKIQPPKPKAVQPPPKTLEELFSKTKCKPHVYYTKNSKETAEQLRNVVRNKLAEKNIKVAGKQKEKDS